MVDIETLGIDPGCAILSIGAVEFTTAGIERTFYKEISVKSCLEHGLEIDGETLEWWLTEDTNPEQTLNALTGQTTLTRALDGFWKWYPNDGAEIWANSPSFDCEHLKYAFDQIGMTEPWEYYEERDVRTIRKLPQAVEMEHEGTEHNALDDAKHQARVVGQTLKKLNENNA